MAHIHDVEATHMIKVVITGAECSGKSTLAEDLSRHYDVPLVPEYARTYLNNLDRPYEQSDLRHIAIGQLESEQQHASEELIICDTSLLVIKVWSQIKYGSLHPWLTVLCGDSTPDLYILPDWDIPYEEDPLREHPDDRKMIYDTYVNELNMQAAPWIAVTGRSEQRSKQAIKKIESMLKENR